MQDVREWRHHLLQRMLRYAHSNVQSAESTTFKNILILSTDIIMHKKKKTVEKVFLLTFLTFCSFKKNASSLWLIVNYYKLWQM